MILPIFEGVDVILVLLYDCVQSCGVEPVDAFWLSEGKSQSYDSVQAKARENCREILASEITADY